MGLIGMLMGETGGFCVDDEERKRECVRETEREREKGVFGECGVA